MNGFLTTSRISVPIDYNIQLTPKLTEITPATLLEAKYKWKIQNNESFNQFKGVINDDSVKNPSITWNIPTSENLDGLDYYTVECEITLPRDNYTRKHNFFHYVKVIP